MSEIENCECAVSDDDEPLLPSNVGHYKLLNLETSIFGPGLFCIRMIGLVFFSYHRGQSPKEEEEG